MVSELRRSYAGVVIVGADGNGNGSKHAGAGASSASTNHTQRNDDFDDPMYLHITENPNLCLVSPPLTELNYSSWSRSIRIALEVKNKFEFAIGSIPSPAENDPKIGSWRRCNRIVSSWILKSISPH